jgi:Protein of unknown function (DUF559)
MGCMDHCSVRRLERICFRETPRTHYNDSRADGVFLSLSRVVAKKRCVHTLGLGRGSVLRQRVRDLRKNSTDAERHLWYYLRANRLGFKFKILPSHEFIKLDTRCKYSINPILDKVNFSKYHESF